MSTGGKLKMKAKKVLSLTFTFVAVMLSVIGLVLYYSDANFIVSSITSYLPFTVNSNIFLVIVGLLFLIIGIIDLVEGKAMPQWIMQLKLAVTTLISITFLTVIFYIAPLWRITDTNIIAYEGANLFLHILAPIVAIFGFCLFDVETKIKWRWTSLLPLLVVIYGVVYGVLLITSRDLSLDIYNFVHEEGKSFDVFRMIVFIVIMLVGTFGLTNLWWSLNLASFKCTEKKELKKQEKKEVAAETVEPVKEEEKPVVAQKEEIKPVQSAPVAAAAAQQTKTQSQATAKVVSKPAPSPAPVKKVVSKPANNLYNGNTRTYHISTTKSLLGKWQVKLAGGEKAIKVCATQQEAIDFTRELVKSQGGSIRLHSLDGRIRKI